MNVPVSHVREDTADGLAPRPRRLTGGLMVTNDALRATADVRPGPVLIAYDGRAAAERALRETSELLRGRKALVVYKAGLVFELVALPAAGAGLPPAPLDKM